MKVMKGVILLEVLISIMISSMIFVSLTSAVFQLSKARVTVDDSIDVHTRVTTIFDLMQQDFGGATVPVQADLPADKAATPVAEAQRKEQPAPEQKSTPQTPEQAAEKKEKEKPITNIFYSTVKNNNIDMISCITNNPTAVYWSDRAGKAKPRIVRVVYTLVADPEHAGSFLLKRQEGTELDLDAYKNPDQAAVRAYEVAEGIKECKVTYLYLEKKEEVQPQQPIAVPKSGEAPKNAESKKEPPAKPDYKSRSDWGGNKEKEESKTTKDPLLPSHMIISLIMFSSTYKKEYSFEFVITLPANEAQQIKQAKMRYQETAAQKTELSKTATPPDNAQKDQSQSPTQKDSSQEAMLVVFNAKPETRDVQENPPALAQKSQEQLVEEMVQKNVEQFYQQMEQEAKGTQSEHSEKDPADTSQTADDEQGDIPQGKIDIIQDGDKTHVVYRGPITITPDLVRGVS